MQRLSINSSRLSLLLRGRGFLHLESRIYIGIHFKRIYKKRIYKCTVKRKRAPIWSNASLSLKVSSDAKICKWADIGSVKTFEVEKIISREKKYKREQLNLYINVNSTFESNGNWKRWPVTFLTEELDLITNTYILTHFLVVFCQNKALILNKN